MEASSNYAKYRTRNPVVRRMIDGFYARLRDVIEPLGAGSALDAGCGEGEAIERLAGALPQRLAAVDISEDSVALTRRRFPELDVRTASVRELPFADREFDLVLCLEVLEHLDDPGVALGELCRVSDAHVVVSVPHEPYFRLGSLARGKHVTRLGNHPEHLQAWGRDSLREFLGSGVAEVSLTGAFPWLIALCRVRDRPG